MLSACLGERAVPQRGGSSPYGQGKARGRSAEKSQRAAGSAEGTTGSFKKVLPQLYCEVRI